MEGVAAFMQFSLDEYVEPVVLPTGTEARVRIRSVEEINSEKRYVRMRLDILGQSQPTKGITYFIFTPRPEDDADRKNAKIGRIRAFCTAFGIPFEVWADTSQWIGKEAWAILTEEEDETYGKQNQIKSWVKPADFY